MLAWITTSTYQRITINVARHLEIVIRGKDMGFTRLILADGQCIENCRKLTYVKTAPVVEKFVQEYNGALTTSKY